MAKLPYVGQWVCLHLFNAPEDRFYRREKFLEYIKSGYFCGALTQRCCVGMWGLSPQGKDYWARIYNRLSRDEESALLG